MRPEVRKTEKPPNDMTEGKSRVPLTFEVFFCELAAPLTSFGYPPYTRTGIVD